ncbi:MAG: serine/threonine protein kinase, partial [Thermoleophilia bacterium]|nr:serine/threonine protein kinase [Thermoleophilia bacterium]
VAGFERLADQHPGAAGYRDQLARSRVTLGLILEGLGRPGDAAAAFAQAVADYRAVLTADGDSPAALADLAAAYSHQYRVLTAIGRDADAKAARDEATAAYGALTRLHPAARELQTGLASVLMTFMPGVMEAASPPPPPGADESESPGTVSVEMSDSITRDFGPTTIDVDRPGAPRGGDARLTLRSLIGQGGAASIFLGFDHELNREIAVKVQNASYGNRPDAHRRFLREAQITAQLEHPNIVPVYGLGHSSQDDAPFLMMRLLRGPTLREAIQRYHERRGPDEASRLELRRLVACVRDVCRALDYAHARGVVHRDPKPANILLGKSGEVVLADWGLAKVFGVSQTDPDSFVVRLGEGMDMEDTAEGAVIGTPAFMAPEHVRGKPDDVGTHTDIFVMGGCLFMILTGQPPN